MHIDAWVSALDQLLVDTPIPGLEPPTRRNPLYEEEPTSDATSCINEQDVIAVIQRIGAECGWTFDTTHPAGIRAPLDIPWETVGDAGQQYGTEEQFPGIKLGFDPNLMDNYERLFRKWAQAYAERVLSTPPSPSRPRSSAPLPACCDQHRTDPSGPVDPNPPSPRACDAGCPLLAKLEDIKSKINLVVAFHKLRRNTASWLPEADLYIAVETVYGAVVEAILDSLRDGPDGSVRYRYMRTPRWLEVHGGVQASPSQTEMLGDAWPAGGGGSGSGGGGGRDEFEGELGGAVGGPVPSFSQHPTDFVTATQRIADGTSKYPPHSEWNRAVVAPTNSKLDLLHSLERSGGVYLAIVPIAAAAVVPELAAAAAVAPAAQEERVPLDVGEGSGSGSGPGAAAGSGHLAEPVTETFAAGWTIRWRDPRLELVGTQRSNLEMQLYQALLELDTCSTGLLHLATWDHNILLRRTSLSEIAIGKLLPRNHGSLDTLETEEQGLVDDRWSTIKLMLTLALLREALPEHRDLLGCYRPRQPNPHAPTTNARKRRTPSSRGGGTSRKRSTPSHGGRGGRGASGQDGGSGGEVSRGGPGGPNMNIGASRTARRAEAGGPPAQDSACASWDIDTMDLSDPGEEEQEGDDGDWSFEPDPLAFPLFGDHERTGLAVDWRELPTGASHEAQHDIYDGTRDSADWHPLSRHPPTPAGPGLQSSAYAHPPPQGQGPKTFGKFPSAALGRVSMYEFRASGRLWDVYLGTYTDPTGHNHGRLIVKIADLASFPLTASQDHGYTVQDARAGIRREIDVYLGPLAGVAGDLVPGVMGVWVLDGAVRSPRQGGREAVCMVLTDAGISVRPEEDEVQQQQGDEGGVLPGVTGPAIRKAFERLHGLGVIHGDPAWRHILLDSWGRIKLIDFDMSQLLEAHSPGRRAELIHDEMATVDEMIYEAGL